VASSLEPLVLQEVAYLAVDGSHPSRLKQLQLRPESAYAGTEVEMALESPRAVTEVARAQVLGCWVLLEIESTRPRLD
jgi:hypothetical protein